MIPKGRTKMVFREVICSTAQSVIYCRKKFVAIGAKVHWNNIKKHDQFYLRDLVGNADR